MKKLYIAFFIFSTFGTYTFAAPPALNNQQDHINVAANCAKNCTSCWDQCTKSDDCGAGHNCSTTPCGTRCVQQ